MLEGEGVFGGKLNYLGASWTIGGKQKAGVLGEAESWSIWGAVMLGEKQEAGVFGRKAGVFGRKAGVLGEAGSSSIWKES